MAQGLTLITPPASEPVTLAEAKAHLRLEIGDDDALVAGLVTAARQHVEDLIAQSLVTQTWQLTLDKFPRYSSSAIWQQYADGLWDQRIPQTELSGRWWPDKASIRLPRPPLQSVSSIQYVASGTGILTTMPSANYLVDASTRPGRVAPAFGQIWPLLQQQLAAVQVNYVAGYGPVTSVAATIAAGTQTVTPATMVGINAGGVLRVSDGLGKAENIQVASVTSTTFTAAFLNSYAAGATVSGVPEGLRLALKLLIGHWYENREAVGQGGMAELPLAAKALLNQFWHGEYV
jgi:hypothetical protein